VFHGKKNKSGSEKGPKSPELSREHVDPKNLKKKTIAMSTQNT
jgi:hypothetical protein